MTELERAMIRIHNLCVGDDVASVHIEVGKNRCPIIVRAIDRWGSECFYETFDNAPTPAARPMPRPEDMHGAADEFGGSDF